MCVCARVCACASLIVSVMFDPVTLWTVAFQAPQSTAFSRQEHWSGLPCFPPGDLPNSEIEPAPPVSPEFQEDSLPTEPPRKPRICIYIYTFREREIERESYPKLFRTNIECVHFWVAGNEDNSWFIVCIILYCLSFLVISLGLKNKNKNNNIV